MQNLTDFAPWSQDFDDLRSKVVLVVERESVFGEFAWTMLLVKSIKLGNRVRIVSLNHSRAHFLNILRKYGLDLKELEASRLVQFFRIDSTESVDEGTWHRLCEFIVGNADSNTAVCLDSTDVLGLISPSQQVSLRILADCCRLVYEAKVHYALYIILLEMCPHQ